MANGQIKSVQIWLPIEKILEDGIIKMKDSSYIKILNVSPINYNLKSNLEKEAILNSYKNLFRSCNFNLQVLIQSKKEDLSKNIKMLKKNNQHEELRESYIKYIQELNRIKKSSIKIYYLIIKESSSDKSEEIKIKNLQNKYLKIKDLLLRCGNLVSEYTSERDLGEVIFSFLNSKNI
ncbi:MAG: hypothetical protein IKG14_05735 [Clostridia bacterium]|nr:hypothetical protein [Clostridia bacterium]